jgi:hypothetical protein
MLKKFGDRKREEEWVIWVYDDNGIEAGRKGRKIRERRIWVGWGSVVLVYIFSLFFILFYKNLVLLLFIYIIKNGVFHLSSRLNFHGLYHHN